MKTPLLSIIIPARNEAHNLPKCIAAISQSLTLAGSPATEIIVVENRSTDNTTTVAQNLGCQVIHNSTKNLSAIRNQGILASQGEIIITIDADSLMSPGLIKEILDTMGNGKFIGGGVNILPDRWSLGILLAFLMINSYLFFFRITCGVFYARRQDFLEIGGFNEKIFSAEDIDLAKRLKSLGQKQNKKYKNIWNEKITTSMRKFDKFGDFFACQHPLEVWKLLRGKPSSLADKIWYDFEEKK